MRFELMKAVTLCNPIYRHERPLLASSMTDAFAQLFPSAKFDEFWCVATDKDPPRPWQKEVLHCRAQVNATDRKEFHTLVREIETLDAKTVSWGPAIACRLDVS